VFLFFQQIHDLPALGFVRNDLQQLAVSLDISLIEESFGRHLCFPSASICILLKQISQQMQVQSELRPMQCCGARDLCHLRREFALQNANDPCRGATNRFAVASSLSDNAVPTDFISRD